MRTNKIRLTESQLHQVIKESVQSILNEISYPTARAAYEKMNDMGQHDRAKQLSHTYGQIHNDAYARYNLADNDLELLNNYIPDEKCTHEDFFKNPGYYYRDGDKLRRDNQDITGEYSDFEPKHRVSNIKRAQAYANHLNNFSGTNKFTRNHFRS